MVSSTNSPHILSLLFIGPMMVYDGTLPMILLAFTDALLFIELSLISLVILSAHVLFILTVITQVTVLALSQYITYDIGAAVSLFSFYPPLNFNPRKMAIGFINM